MSIDSEYLRGMKVCVEIIDKFIVEKRFVREESLLDLQTVRNGLSMGIAIAEADLR